MYVDMNECGQTVEVCEERRGSGSVALGKSTAFQPKTLLETSTHHRISNTMLQLTRLSI